MCLKKWVNFHLRHRFQAPSPLFVWSFLVATHEKSLNKEFQGGACSATLAGFDFTWTTDIDVKHLCSPSVPHFSGLFHRNQTAAPLNTPQNTGSYFVLLLPPFRKHKLMRVRGKLWWKNEGCVHEQANRTLAAGKNSNAWEDGTIGVRCVTGIHMTTKFPKSFRIKTFLPVTAVCRVRGQPAALTPDRLAKSFHFLQHQIIIPLPFPPPLLSLPNL